MNDLRVLIVAEDPLARAGIGTLLADELGCTVVGQVSNTNELAADARLYNPDVIVADVGWNPSSGLQDGSDLVDLATPVVALVQDQESAAEVWVRSGGLRSIPYRGIGGSGVRGILLRDEDGASLMAALTAVSNGMVVISPDLARALLPDRDRPRTPPIQPLTPREMGVLQLLAEGLANKSIAHRLDISEHTVKFHVNSILSKLDAQSRTEAVVHATRQGLVLL